MSGVLPFGLLLLELGVCLWDFIRLDILVGVVDAPVSAGTPKHPSLFFEQNSVILGDILGEPYHFCFRHCLELLVSESIRPCTIRFLLVHSGPFWEIYKGGVHASTTGARSLISGLLQEITELMQ